MLCNLWMHMYAMHAGSLWKQAHGNRRMLLSSLHSSDAEVSCGVRPSTAWYLRSRRAPTCTGSGYSNRGMPGAENTGCPAE